LLRAHERARAAQVDDLSSEITAVMAFRVTTDARADLLDQIVGRLAADLGRRVPIVVGDASPPGRTEHNEIVLRRPSLQVDYHQMAEGLAATVLHLLERVVSTSFFYLQFDDQVTVGMTPELLAVSAELLRRYNGAIPVVAIPWPTHLEVDHQSRHIRVATHAGRTRRGRREYSFGGAPFRAPVFEVDVCGRVFGVFENFTYGFFFNHLVAPTAQYAATLRAHMAMISEDAHRIELATRWRRAPGSWRFIAIPLDGVALLDLDFEHTDAAVRPEHPEHRQRLQALRDGYSIVTSVIEAP
jgi:hypothetical protein